MQYWRILRFVSVLLILGIVSTSLAQNEVTNIILGDVDAGNFPEVQVDFRAINSSGLALDAITSGQVRVVEDNVSIQDVAIRPLEASPISVVFVLDEGRYPIYGRLEDTIHLAIGGLTRFFQDEHDQVAILHSTSNGISEILPFTNSVSDFREAVNVSLSASGGDDSNSIANLQRTLELIQSNNLPQQGPVDVVFISRRIDIETPQIQRVIDEASQANIRIHVLHATMTPSDDRQDTMQQISNNTGGGYWQLTPQGFNLDEIETIYQFLDNQRARYELTFTSDNHSNSQRQIQIQVGEATTQTTYDLPSPISAPTVTINDPDAGQSIDREQNVETVSETEANLTFNVNSYTVRANYNQTDDYNRPLQMAELLVNGQSVQSLPQPTNLSFTWDLTSIRENGDNPQTLVVRVVDSLGLEAQSEPVQVKIPITVPEDMTIITETVVASYCEQDANSWNCRIELLRTYAPYIALAVAVFTALYFRRQVGRVAVGGVQAVGSVMTDIGTVVRKTILGTQVAGAGSGPSPVRMLGKIEVLQGPDAYITGTPSGKNVDIYNRVTRIGRDPSRVDVQFYGPDDQTSVSRLHATITYDTINECFTLTDENSSAGVRINGEKITPLEPIMISDSDEILLGSPSKPNVKLRVMLYQEDMAPASDDSDETVPQKPSTGLPTAVYSKDDPTNGPVKPESIESESVELEPTTEPSAYDVSKFMRPAEREPQTGPKSGRGRKKREQPIGNTDRKWMENLRD